MRVLPWLVAILGIWYFCLRILGPGLEYIPGDKGDARFIHYLLEHGYLYLKGEQASFWSASFMYPYPHTIAISDNMMGTLPIYTLWRSMGFTMETSYQLWWIVIAILNFVSAYWVAKKWSGSTLAAVIIAWIFAFTLFNLAQLNYMQMLIRFPVPLALYFGVKMIDSSSWKHMVSYAAMIVLQFYCVMYTGFFLFYFSIGFLLLYLIISRRWKFFTEIFSRSQWWISTLVILTSSFLLLILMKPYMQTAHEMGLRLFGEVKWNIPVWQGYFFAHHASTVWGGMGENMAPSVGDWWLQYAFAGMIPLLVLLSIPVVLIYGRIRKVKIDPLLLTLLITSLIIALLFIRTDTGYTLYALIFKLPGMNSMRVMNRFMNVELLFLLLILLFWIRDLKPWKLAVFSLLVFADTSFDATEVVRTSKKEMITKRTEVLRLVELNRKPHHRAFAWIRTDQTPCYNHLDAMMASLHTDLPTVNGYSSTCPDAFGEFFNMDTQAGLERWLMHNNINPRFILILNK